MAVVSRALLALLVVLGIVVAPMQLPAANAISTTRYAGADRFATSVEVSKWSSGLAGSTVFLASGLKFPDALAAGPVAAAEGAHLLLTRPDRVDDSVMRRIEEIQPTEIVIVGSEASISAAVAIQVQGATGALVTRVGGRDRVETSLQLLDRLTGKGPVDTVWVASGHNFPDALVAASVAGGSRAGIILDYHDGTSAGVESWRQRILSHVSGRVVNIAGGAPSVSGYDEQVLRWSGTLGVFRYSGADRYDTARVINDTFNARPSDRTMLLATGENFPDALAGAVHAALRGIPLYLTTSACHPGVSDMLRGEASERGIQTVIGLGGAPSISDQALNLGPCPAPVTYTALQTAMGARYGMFVPRYLSGSGDQVLDLGGDLQTGLIRSDMDGSGNNIVWTLNSGYQRNDLVVNEIGNTAGTRLFGGPYSDATRFLQVTADGPWSIQVLDIRNAQEFGGYASGATDAVYLYGGGVGTVQATHASGGNFIVWELYRDRYGDTQDLLFNAIGNYSGATPIAAGPAILDIEVDSSWSLTLR